MRCVQFAEYGPPEVLRLAEVERPVPGVGELLVAVKAIGVNPADTKWRAGMFRERIPLGLPHIPGYDIAGIVTACGTDIAGYAPGDRLFAMLNNVVMGAYAEFVLVTAADAASIPDALRFDAAAALPTAALTGVQMIDEQLRPTTGQNVLVTGATGAVGRFALFAAKAAGAHVVVAVRASQRDEASALGADKVIILGEEDWSGPAFDLVADTVGGPCVARLCRHVTPGGLIRTVSTTPIDPGGLTAEPVFFGVHADAAQLSRIARAVADGTASMPIAHRLPLGDAAEAHRIVEAGGAGGKVILLP